MRLFPPRLLAAAADAVAIVVFAIVGLLSHHGDVSADGLARDVLPLLGGWLGAALAFGLYRRPALRRLAATWLVGITAGIAIRAIVLGHDDAGKEASFLGVALASTLVFALAARLLVSVAALPTGAEPRR